VKEICLLDLSVGSEDRYADSELQMRKVIQFSMGRQLKKTVASNLDRELRSTNKYLSGKSGEMAQIIRRCSRIAASEMNVGGSIGK
jgi:hypothetical protein